jgi:hypothetical protein
MASLNVIKQYNSLIYDRNSKVSVIKVIQNELQAIFLIYCIQITTIKCIPDQENPGSDQYYLHYHVSLRCSHQDSLMEVNEGEHSPQSMSPKTFH